MIELLLELIAGLSRAIANVFAELVLELAIRGPGYLICRKFERHIDPDSAWVVVSGIMFWAVIGCAAYYVYSYVMQA